MLHREGEEVVVFFAPILATEEVNAIEDSDDEEQPPSQLPDGDKKRSKSPNQTIDAGDGGDNGNGTTGNVDYGEGGATAIEGTGQGVGNAGLPKPRTVAVPVKYPHGTVNGEF